MSATMNGCDIVCPWPMGSGLFTYARILADQGTNLSRSTLDMASITRGSSSATPV